MKLTIRCALMQCAKDNSFCVLYLIGLGVAMAFMTALIFDGGLLVFGICLAGLLAVGAWYLKTCYVNHDRQRIDQAGGKAMGEES